MNLVIKGKYRLVKEVGRKGFSIYFDWYLFNRNGSRNFFLFFSLIRY